jgi:pSer/pThr/pTyr-binding forkhead associated (FHA) protein
MDVFTLSLWLLRIGFVVLIYLFLFMVARAMWNDLRAGVSGAGQPLGRLVVIAAHEGRPAPGTNFALDAVNSIGRDVNNSIVIDDSFVSAEHSMLTFRGRAWSVEDRGSTNGTWLNGQRVEGLLPLGYGDELQIGQVRLRLERSRQA